MGAVRVALLLPLALLAVALLHVARAHDDGDVPKLVNDTPCLFEYRMWFYTFRRAETFPQPEQFTAEQCAHAAAVHERILAGEPARETRNDAAAASAATARRADEDARAAAEAAKREAEDARQRRLDAAIAAKRRAAAAAQVKLPGVRIGMTPEEVLNRTSWGKPYERRRITTEGRLLEIWDYGYGNTLTFANGRLVMIEN